MKWAVLVAMLAGCIPDFQLDTRTFPETGAEPDGSPFEDAAPIEDAEVADAEAVDLGSADTGVHADADLPTDTGPPFEDCENGEDDDSDDDVDCADTDCETYQGQGWECRNSARAETDCSNNLDDDQLNDGFDCHDSDCGCAGGALTCCPNGECISLPAVCS